MRSSNLYVILDRDVAEYDRLFEVARACLENGVGMMQLRDKTGLARDILCFSKKILRLFQRKALYIINDRVDLAIASGADGVHLGQGDIPLKLARKMMFPGAIIGVSCQGEKALRTAREEGADYIGLGSVFKTKTKPGRFPMDLKFLSRLLKKTDIPVFPIGGICPGNISMVIDAGARRVAVCRAVCEAKDIAVSVKKLKHYLEKAI